MNYHDVHRSEAGTVFGYTDKGSRTFLASPADRSDLHLNYPPVLADGSRNPHQYAPGCSCCWLGFLHSSDYHARELESREGVRAARVREVL